MRRVPMLLVALAVAVSTSCNKKDASADGHKITTESTYDASEPIVHDGFRFRLDVPGEGWKLMRKEDIRKIVPDAVAGAMHRDNMFGGIIVEHLPGISLDGALELVAIELPSYRVELDETIDFHGLAARRTVFTAEIEGNPLRYLRVVFVREGFVYQLLAWGREAKTSADVLDSFMQAFSLTEGEIRGEVDDRPPIERADGVTWRIRDGQFESAVSGLRLPAVDSWHYLVGVELLQTNPDAELALGYASGNGYVTVISERVEGDPSAMLASLRTNLTATLGPGTEERSRTIAGQDVPFVRYEQDALEFLVGIANEGGAVSQITAWYPKALGPTVVPAFDEVVARMSRMSPEDRAALRTELLARDGVVWKVAADTAFLGDHFDDFRHRITWRPMRQGLYDVQIGDEAKIQSANAVLSLTEPLMSAHGHIEVIEGEGDDARMYHESVAGTLDGRRDEIDVVDHVTVWRSFGTDDIDGLAFHYAVASASHEGNAVVMTAWTPVGSAAAPDTVAQVTAGLRFPAVLPETSTSEGRFVDYHYGVSAAGPPGWSHSLEVPDPLLAGRLSKWSKGKSYIAMFMIPTQGVILDEAWLASFAEQNLRDRFAAIAPQTEPTTSRSTIDGQPSRRLTYPSVTIDVVIRNSVVYMVTMAGVDADEADRFRSAMRWLR